MGQNKGCAKQGRNKNKEHKRGTPLSQLVRGRISNETYLKLTGQKAK
jgi:hypothetical protein